MPELVLVPENQSIQSEILIVTPLDLVGLFFFGTRRSGPEKNTWCYLGATFSHYVVVLKNWYETEEDISA